jgi:MFS transporter, SHS family, lactate transporter
MTAAQDASKRIPWWKEPTKEQWLAWWAAWLGWTLDAFDFTMFPSWCRSPRNFMSR